MTRTYATAPLALKTPPDHLSWSQVARLVPNYRFACARAWAYDKLAGLPFESSPALAAGDAFDDGVNSLLVARMQGRDEGTALEWATRAVGEKLPSAMERVPNPPGPDKIEEYIGAVNRALAHFARERVGLIPAAVQTKHRYTVRQRDGEIRSLVGYSDRIDPDGAVVDHKYSGSARWHAGTPPEVVRGDVNDELWDGDWVRDKMDQLCVYWLARRAEEARGVNQPAPVIARGKLDVMFMRVDMKMPQLRSYVVEFNEEDERRVLEAIRQAHDIIRDGRLPARPGEACGFCSHTARCRADEERRGASFAEVIGS